MVWMETCAVDERMRFVITAEKQEEPFAVICRRFGVSRRVGYKWVALSRSRRRRFARSLASTGASFSYDWGGDQRTLPGGAARASDLGSGEGAGLAQTSGPSDGMARDEHDRSVVRS
jgi:hypothetical protein